MTDATVVAVGMVLQVTNVIAKPKQFFFAKMAITQRNYNNFSGEHLAIYLAIKNFRHILDDWIFSVFTDHKPMT